MNIFVIQPDSLQYHKYFWFAKYFEAHHKSCNDPTEILATKFNVKPGTMQVAPDLNKSLLFPFLFLRLLASIFQIYKNI